MRIGMACRLREARETAPGAMSKERSGMRIGMACRLTERKIYKVALTKECFARYNIVCFNRCIHKGAKARLAKIAFAKLENEKCEK